MRSAKVLSKIKKNYIFFNFSININESAWIMYAIIVILYI